MIARSKILGSALVGASLFAFAAPAGAQTSPSSIPSECLSTDGVVTITEQNAAQCSVYDTTSSIVPPNSVINDDSSGTNNSGASDDDKGPEAGSN